MKKRIITLSITVLLLFLFCINSFAATHIVQKGESMWKIAVKYQVGVSEIISANPQVSNPDLIYPNQKLEIPLEDEGVRAFEKEVIRLTNQYRASQGLAALTENWELSRVARFKSWDMRDRKYFAHESPTYGSPFTMMKNFGISYRSAGENIAKGYKTPAAVVEGWWNSPGHKANMLNKSFTQIGVGYVADGNYWTQMFIG
ncbi:MAG: SafA/ExsA family spore coat assembly protein [Oscillospiraceae bacterium]|jgi:uncharacterized YkwD family protein/spore coat assembly protein SafA|nr:SafA/ExsA family spore coat assembly protein [Oscillospiraceae bacterium]